MMKQLRKRDEGFTLVELLIAISIMGIVMGGLATGFITTLRGTKNLHERFLESQGAQLLATYFPSDVQSANPAMIDGPTASPADECSGITGTHVIRMRWTQIEGSALTAFSASYRLTTTPDGGVLTRWFCTATGTATDPVGGLLKTKAATPKVVARNLAATVPAVNVAANSVDMTLASFKTGYTYKFTGTTRTPGVWLALAAGAPSPANPAAGGDVTIQLTAKDAAGATDSTFAGTKTFMVSGFSASPNGTTPLSTVTGNFTAGVGTVTFKLYKAGATNLTFTSGVYRSSITSAVNVNAGPYQPGTLSFSACPPNIKAGQSTALQLIRSLTDAYGNTVTAAGGETATLTQTGGAALAPSSASFTANAPSSTTFTVTNPVATGTAVTLTATSGTVTDTCSYTTNNPSFKVTAAPTPVAGSQFTLTVTATTDGTATDTAYTGPKTLTFSGPGNAPNGTAPIYAGSINPTATVTFTNGVANVPVTLYRAQSATVTVSESASGLSGSLPVTVGPGTMSLGFSACPATHKKNTSLTQSVTRQDAWGNPSGTPTDAAVSVSGGGNFTTPSGTTATSFSVTVPSGSSASPSFSYNAPNSNNTSITLTVSAAGFTPVNCSFTTANN